MGLGTSVFLIVVGAILRFAVSVTTKGFNLHTVGLILLLAGIVGLVIWGFWMAAYSDRRRRADYVVREREVPVVRERL
jgi:hypothetical protein